MTRAERGSCTTSVAAATCVDAWGIHTTSIPGRSKVATNHGPLSLSNFHVRITRKERICSRYIVISDIIRISSRYV